MKSKNITCIYQAFAQRFVEAPLVAITASSLEKLNNNEWGASACFQISPETFNQVLSQTFCYLGYGFFLVS